MPNVDTKELETIYPGKHGYAYALCEQCQRYVLFDAAFGACECGAVLPMVIERKVK